MSVRLHHLLLLLALAAAPATAQPAADPILRAMQEEMSRIRRLGLVSLDAPYYCEYALDDAEMFSATATLGGLVSARNDRLRLPRVRVRVGSAQFDNTNYVFSDYYRGSRFDLETWPLEDNPAVLRQQLWLATDRAYKTAIEAISRKRAALKNVSVTEKLNDYAQAEPVRMVLPVKRVPPNQAATIALARRLSTVFEGFASVISSSVDVEDSENISYFLTTQGTEARTLDRLGIVRVRAFGIAADGMRLHDAAIIQSADPSRLPVEAELRREVTAVAENVTALAAAPVGDAYTGPVLFEERAAAQLFAQLLGNNVALHRRPVAEPGRPAPVLSSEFEGRTGSRVLPEWMDVVDDATQTEWRGRLLFGHYPIDMEGVPPQPVTLIEKGVLKAFLTTRQPVPGFEGSNGHARLPGSFGANSARISNLFIRASQPVTAPEMKKRLLEMVQQRNKPYGILVRKLDFPSSASMEELRRIGAAAQAGGSVRALSPPLLVYRVYADGREELVRGLRFRSVTAKSLRDIVAASDQVAVFDYLDNGAPMAMIGAGGYVANCSVIAPGVLLEELELERPQENIPAPPRVPPPPLRAAR